MRVPVCVLLLLAALATTACATSPGGSGGSRSIVVEVINAPVDLGPLTIWVHPIFQSTGRARLGDVLPGEGGTFTYDAPAVGTYSLRAVPHLMDKQGPAARVGILSDTQHVTWDLRSNSVQVR